MLTELLVFLAGQRIVAADFQLAAFVKR